MNGYTSGLQALQGRAGSQKCYDCGDPATHQYRNAYGPGKHMPVCETDGQYYRNQGESVLEYSVLDNPILVAFREEYESVGKWNWEDKGALTYAWLRKFREPWLDEAECWTNAEIDHAMRVLTKLAALNA